MTVPSRPKRDHHRLRITLSVVFFALVAASVIANAVFVIKDETPASPSAFDLLVPEAGHTRPPYNLSAISRPLLIPNRILRTWKTSSTNLILENSKTKKDHPDRYKWFTSWSKLNPSATQLIFNDDDMDKFVRGAFSKRVVEAYFKLPRIVLRSDFARYMMLYELGGYYSDMDTSCSVAIHHWNLGIEQAAVIIGVENPSLEKDNYLQWTMASAPHHPLLANVIHRVTEKIHATSIESLLSDDGAVLEVTGPGIWKTVIQEYLQSQGTNLQKIANMWDGYQLVGDVLILGKSYLNNDNSDNPKSLIRHHFTGFSEFGWRVHGKKTVNVTLSAVDDDFDFSYRAPIEFRDINPIKEGKPIPKRVVQVANSSDPALLSPRFQEFRAEWIQLNPEHKFILLSELDMEEFVRKEGSEDERRAFFKLPLFKQRLELFRFISLARTGGVYTEIDTSCRVPIDKWTGGRASIGFVAGMGDQSHPQGPGFIRTTLASIPNHPIITGFLALKVKEILTLSPETLRTISFFDVFENGFNQFLKTALANEGFDVANDFRTMSWEAYASSRDVLVLGQERFRASHGRSKLMFVENHGDVWGEEHGIWKSNQVATSLER
ncbi:membrane-bound alpha-1,6- mannosyltransferase Initiation-specific [Podochytrium sp. JEL0797]|nr:membrane-bound alpha-1,6- mannosyltransferase Initiation-specific [Podochytrium sp. JEL0797]